MANRLKLAGYRRRDNADKTIYHYVKTQTTNARRTKTKRNPLKGDPTRTATLRRKFIADLNSRFAILKKRLRKLIVEDDAFGLNRLRVNVFCPTGEGGGVDPTCSPTSKTMYRGIGEGADTTSGFEWFSETPKLAQQYADFRGGEVRAVAVSYSKPLNIGNGNEVLSPRSFVAKAIDQADVKSLDKQSVLKSRKEFLSVFGDTSIKVSDYWSTPLFKESTRKLLESFGYDSIKMIEGGEQTVAILRKAATTNQQIENAERFEFQTSAQKVEAFRRWLKQQMELLLVKDDLDIRNDWWDKYIEEGYKQGAGRAFDDTRKPYAKGYAKEGKLSDFYLGSKEEFLRSSFAQPVAREKVKLLAGRVFTDLKGISNSMSTKLVRTLTDGLVQGKNPRAIAKDIDDTVEGIDRSRANAIARTEIIRCHAEGQLDAFENLGVTEVGVAAEWTTAEDEKVCALCSPLEGVVMKVEEARGLLPRHPNCRCAWLPANVGEDQSEQKNTKKEIDEALEESVDLEGGEEKSKWLGADADVAKQRPESILNVFCPTGEGGGIDPSCSPSGILWSTENGVYEIVSALMLQKHRGMTVKTVERNIEGSNLPEVDAAIAYRKFSKEHKDYPGWFKVEHLGSSGKTKGAGTKLLKDLMVKAAKQQVGIFLVANPASIGFYEHLGFKHTNRSFEEMIYKHTESIP